MKVEEVNRCQIQEWYPKFESVSIKTIIHQLPESFVPYLLGHGRGLFPDYIYIWHNLTEESFPRPSFPELGLKVRESIESLGGAVFPKLNWSAPKDRKWARIYRDLRCTTFNDVAFLLRSSGSIFHDLRQAYDSCEDKSSSRPQNFFLALREWYPSLSPEMEFRCFVRGQKLIAISQREVTEFYPALLEKKSDLLLLMQCFFNNNVRTVFESEDYTFDVYITNDERVEIVDFSPWGASTLPLLFTWKELRRIPDDGDGDGVKFRIVEDPRAVQQWH